MLLLNNGGIENRVAIRRRLVLRRLQRRRGLVASGRLPQGVRLVWIQNGQVLMILVRLMAVTRLDDWSVLEVLRLVAADPRINADSELIRVQVLDGGRHVTTVRRTRGDL